ncbi:uncharacterized protein [Lolium perenne]|uniref:uncharacterized protein n=1 Tax=Lolium perenne TaxID=4522 RepID=UPI0021F5D302|nr:uncharacterized protein LOC127296186 [Lolium perenne]
MDHQPVHPGPESPVVDLEMGHQAAESTAVNQQRIGWHRPNPWASHDANTLLVVATLITTLSYQIGTSLPGGYWQETQMQDGKMLYRAGDPIMRDLQNARYWMFMVASWTGLISSMLMTMSLLVGIAVDSWHVRWSFVVAYSSLLLTFVLSGNRTKLHIDIIFWAGSLAFFWVVIYFRPEHRKRIVQVLRSIPATTATNSTS